MGIKKAGSKWLVDIYPHGREGKRVRKSFATKIEAQRFEKFVLSKAFENKDWNAQARDGRKLNDLAEIWYQQKGIYLKDGVKRKRRVTDVSEWMGNPIASNVRPSDWAKYSAALNDKGLSGKTINNHLGYVNSVYNYLYEIDEISFANPLAKVRMIKLDEKELSWLTLEEIKHLLRTIESFSKNPHVHILSRVCLATGARWGEAEVLTKRSVRESKITFDNTKGFKSRSVPVDQGFADEINGHLDRYGSFTSSLSAFRRALIQTGIELPKGQASHVLRHSFASHFMMNGGNILTLQKILGHSSVNVTMRYAHLAPDHLIASVRLNPLASV